MGKKISKRRRRRKHSEEFKREAVNLVLHEGLSVKEAATNLGIHPSLLQQWKQKFESAQESSLTEDERVEIARLRAENRRLRMERDILKKAAAFFANEKN